MQASDGLVYGTTSAGGALGAGSIFRMMPAGDVTPLTSFAPNDARGDSPVAPLVQGPDGTLWGTTQAGGLQSCGTLFGMDLDGQVLHVQEFSEDGGCPSAAPVTFGADGLLVGTTESGGWNGGGAGTVFRIAPRTAR
jgi:uncharacterized repeat protein (TIGR03803 family)